MSDDKSIFKELNEQIKKTEGAIPDTLTIGGQTFRRVGAPPGPIKRLGKWKNPRKPNEEPVECELESVLINVAPHADRIILDGVHYLANRTYEVPLATAATMRDIISQTWKHEHQTGGANSYNAGPARNPAYAASLGGGVGYSR